MSSLITSPNLSYNEIFKTDQTVLTIDQEDLQYFFDLCKATEHLDFTQLKISNNSNTLLTYERYVSLIENYCEKNRVNIHQAINHLSGQKEFHIGRFYPHQIFEFYKNSYPVQPLLDNTIDENVRKALLYLFSFIYSIGSDFGNDLEGNPEYDNLLERIAYEEENGDDESALLEWKTIAEEYKQHGIVDQTIKEIRKAKTMKITSVIKKIDRNDNFNLLLLNLIEEVRNLRKYKESLQDFLMHFDYESSDCIRLCDLVKLSYREDYFEEQWYEYLQDQLNNLEVIVPMQYEVISPDKNHIEFKDVAYLDDLRQFFTNLTKFYRAYVWS